MRVKTTLQVIRETHLRRYFQSLDCLSEGGNCEHNELCKVNNKTHSPWILLFLLCKQTVFHMTAEKEKLIKELLFTWPRFIFSSQQQTSESGKKSSEGMK